MYVLVHVTFEKCQASLFTLLVKLVDEVYYCQTKGVGDKYRFLPSQLV